MHVLYYCGCMREGAVTPNRKTSAPRVLKALSAGSTHALATHAPFTPAHGFGQYPWYTTSTHHHQPCTTYHYHASMHVHVHKCRGDDNAEAPSSSDDAAFRASCTYFKSETRTEQSKRDYALTVIDNVRKHLNRTLSQLSRTQFREEVDRMNSVDRLRVHQQ